MKYTYESTYEDCSPDGTVTISAEIRLTYSVIWGCPARIHYDEHDHPAEGDELEIKEVEIEYFLSDGSLFWRGASPMELSTLTPWIEAQSEEMLQNAREADADAKAEATEKMAEMEDEWSRMDGEN